jgi:hypothetical protein
VVVVEVAEIADEEVVGVNATSICTKGMVASRGTTKTHGTVRMVEAGITREGDTINPRTTIPQLKLTAAHTEGIHRIATIRITNRAGTEVRLNRRMIHGLHINSPLTEVVEEGIILDTTARMVGRTGTLEGEEAHLPIEGKFRRTVAVGTGIEEVREGDIDMVVTVVGTTIPRRTPVMVEVATTEVAVTNPVGVISLAEVTNPVEVINLVGVIILEVTRPADRTAPASSLMEAEDTTREVAVAGGDTNHKKQTLTHSWYSSPLLEFAPSIFSSYSDST